MSDHGLACNEALHRERSDIPLPRISGNYGMALSRFLLRECARLMSGRSRDTRKRFQAGRAYCLQPRTAMRAMLVAYWRRALAAILGAALLALAPLSAEAHSGPHGQAHASLHEQTHNGSAGFAATNASDNRYATVATAPFQCPDGPGASCCCNSACAVGTPTPAIADAPASSLLIEPPISLLSQSPSGDRAPYSTWLLVSSPPRAPPLS